MQIRVFNLRIVIEYFNRLLNNSKGFFLRIFLKIACPFPFLLPALASGLSTCQHVNYRQLHSPLTSPDGKNGHVLFAILEQFLKYS
jgi:hypothetical protein